MKYPLQISLAVRQGLSEPVVNKLVRVNSWHRKPQVCPLVEATLPGEEAKVPSLTSFSQEAELVYTTIYSSRSLAINAFFPSNRLGSDDMSSLTGRSETAAEVCWQDAQYLEVAWRVAVYSANIAGLGDDMFAAPTARTRRSQKVHLIPYR